MPTKPKTANKRFYGTLKTQGNADLLYDLRLKYDITVADVLRVGMSALNEGDRQWLLVAKGVEPVVEDKDNASQCENI